jgi:SNF2 family DNA or RNA helicase
VIQFDIKKFKSVPFAHQVEGVKALLKNPAFALFDEMGAGKSKQVIDAACILAEARVIDTVVVVAPASVRCVWIDPEIGEIKKHAWLPSYVFEFHSKTKQIWASEGNNEEGRLCWYVTNYEFLRQPERLKEFMKYIPKRTLLVLDEGSYIKSRTAKQTKAILKLREICDRCVLLNGTPVTDSPLDLWAQMKVLDPQILGRKYTNFYHFRANYAVMGGWQMKQVVDYINIDKLSNIIKPYVLRREKKDCLDLPPKLYTQREVALSPAAWKMYRELKKEAVISLGPDHTHVEPNSAVRIMRLAQLTSGFLGGVLEKGQEELDPSLFAEISKTIDTSDEKIKWMLEYLLHESKSKFIIVWTRWRNERERMVKELREAKGSHCLFQIYGDQKASERNMAVQFFSGVTTDKKPVKSILIAQPQAGGIGLNLVAATEAVYMSNLYSLGSRLQSEDRCHRPGQEHPVTYVDLIATGPNGQKTVDSAILKALREKQEIAHWTCERWRKELSDD